MRRRPFFWPAAGLGAGVLLGKLFPLPNSPVFLFTLFLLPFLWFLRGRRFFLPLFLLSLAGLGILRIHSVGRIPPHHILNFSKGAWTAVEGRAASLPEVKEKGRRKIYSFLLDSENLVLEKKFYETAGRVQVFLFNPNQEIPYGSRVRLWGRLERPEIPRNPGEFNYRDYLAGQGIYALLSAYGPRSVRVLDRDLPLAQRPLQVIQNLREASARRLDALFAFPINAFLKALLLGLRKGLPDEFRDDFMKTGTTHLLAISGMNITLVAGSLFFLAILARFPQKLAAGVGLVSTVSYVFLSGAGIPVVRAGWMAGIFFTGLLLEREKDLLNNLFFALFAILIFDPEALFQVGFQLSFLSVLSLILVRPRPLEEWAGEWFQTGIVLVGTFPLGVLYFNVFSGSALFSNLLAVPLFHLGSMAGIGSLTAGDLPVFGTLLVKLAALLLKAGLGWISLWSKISWGYVYLRPPSAWLVAFYYGALAFALMAGKLKSSRLSFLGPLSVSLWLLSAALFFLPGADRNLAVTFLEAGQNEILHVRFPGGRHWLVNAGRRAPSDQGRWLVSPFLRREGVKRLEGVVLTGSAARHTGALPTLLRNFSVSSLFFAGPGEKGANLKRVNRTRLRSGDRIQFQGESGFWAPAVVEDSVFLILYQGPQKILLVPTWKKKILEAALPRLKELVSVDLLIFPSGRTDRILAGEILQTLSPRKVVFVRKDPEALALAESLTESGVPCFFIPETGALRLGLEEAGLTVTPFLKT